MITESRNPSQGCFLCGTSLPRAARNGTPGHLSHSNLQCPSGMWVGWQIVDRRWGVGEHSAVVATHSASPWARRKLRRRVVGRILSAHATSVAPPARTWRACAGLLAPTSDRRRALAARELERGNSWRVSGAGSRASELLPMAGDGRDGVCE